MKELKNLFLPGFVPLALFSISLFAGAVTAEALASNSHLHYYCRGGEGLGDIGQKGHFHQWQQIVYSRLGTYWKGWGEGPFC